MMVCQPSPQKSIPIIAKQITDRDNTVRSAAMNTMVFVHAYVGEGVYKFTTQVQFIVLYMYSTVIPLKFRPSNFVNK